MTKPSITGHMIVKNEQAWIKYAILSVINHLNKLIIFDTGSTDKTIEIIKSIKSPKIKFEQKGEVNRKQLVNLRNEQISLTKTSWFLLIDGDEIWPEKNLIKLINSTQKSKTNVLALVNKTRNCIKDIYHYLPDNKGDYKIGNWKGHLNIRLIKNKLGLKVVGEYPLEAYTHNNIPLQDQPKNLDFVDTWYLHTTHLKRSTWKNQLNVIDRIKKFKLFGQGIKLDRSELPEVLKNEI